MRDPLKYYAFALLAVIAYSGSAACRSAGCARIPHSTRRPDLDVRAKWTTSLDEHYRSNNAAEGLRIAEEIRPESFRNPALIGRVARAYRRGGMLSKSQSVLDRLPPDTPDCVALLERHWMNDARGRTGNAEADFAQLMLKCRDNPEVMLLDPSLSVRETFAFVKHESGYPFDWLRSIMPHLLGEEAFRRRIESEPLCTIDRLGECAFAHDRRNNALICQATINGTERFSVRLDTGGADVLVMDARIAALAALPEPVDGVTLGIRGFVPCKMSLAASVRLGDIIVCGVPVTIIEGYAPEPDEVVGTLGLDVLAGHRVTFDMEREVLTVSESGIEPADQEKAGDVLQFWRVRRMPVLEIVLAGRARACVLDTGSNNTLASWAVIGHLAAELQVEPAKGEYVVEGPGGDQSYDLLALPDGAEFGIGRLRVTMRPLVGVNFLDGYLSDVLGIEVGMLLGCDLFAQARKWVIDYPQRKIVVSWNNRMSW